MFWDQPGNAATSVDFSEFLFVSMATLRIHWATVLWVQFLLGKRGIALHGVLRVIFTTSAKKYFTEAEHREARWRSFHWEASPWWGCQWASCRRDEQRRAAQSSLSQWNAVWADGGVTFQSESVDRGTLSGSTLQGRIETFLEAIQRVLHHLDRWRLWEEKWESDY